MVASPERPTTPETNPFHIAPLTASCMVSRMWFEIVCMTRWGRKMASFSTGRAIPAKELTTLSEYYADVWVWEVSKPRPKSVPDKPGQPPGDGLSHDTSTAPVFRYALSRPPLDARCSTQNLESSGLPYLSLVPGNEILRARQRKGGSGGVS